MAEQYRSDVTDLDGRETGLPDDEQEVIEIDAAEPIDGEDGEEDEEESEDFYENLAENMQRKDRQSLAGTLIDDVSADEESRKPWEQRVKQALEMLGLKEIPDNELAFPGASSAVFPMIGEAAVQFQSRTMPEMIPSDGPVKTTIIGNQDETDATERADQLADYLNYRLMYDDTEWFDDTDQMLFYLPLGGSAFRKVFTDPITGKAKSRFIKGEDFIVPYKAKSLSGAQRYTHRFEESQNDIERAISFGEYVDYKVDEAQPTPNSEWSDSGDDRQESFANDDSMHEILEVHCYLSLDADSYSEDFKLPYVVTVDKTQNEILCIRRNWREDDEFYEKIVWFSHYKFMPGTGFYGFGFLHMIGGLAEATTGAMRGLLDASIRSNTQGGYKSKDAREVNGDHTISPGVWKDTELTAEELSKAFYTPPWKEPSQALMELMQFLSETGQRFTSTTETMTGDASPNAPVGTTVALIEQGQKVFSAIHRRLHVAAGNEYRLFADLDMRSIEGEQKYRFKGNSGTITPEHFSDDIDILPVSDPNIFSQTQRVAMAQAVVELVKENPDIYGRKEKLVAHRRLLEALRVPDYEKVLPDEDDIRIDPLTENQYLMTGKGVIAFPEQDHQAHIQIHQNVIQQFQSMQGPQVQQMMQAAEAHLAEHHAYAYRQQIQRMLPFALPGGMSPDGNPQELPVEAENELARVIAMTMAQVPTPAQQQNEQQQNEQQSEQQRKDAEMQAEQKRKDEQAQAEEHRKQAGWQADQERKQAGWEAEQRREAAEFQLDQHRGHEGWKAEQHRESQQRYDARREKNIDAATDRAAQALNNDDGDG